MCGIYWKGEPYWVSSAADGWLSFNPAQTTLLTLSSLIPSILNRLLSLASFDWDGMPLAICRRYNSMQTAPRPRAQEPYK